MKRINFLKMKLKKNQKKTANEKITKKIIFSELLEKHPESVETLMESGMHCIGCPMSMQETLEEGALAHGIDPEKLTEEINKKLGKK